MVLVKIWRIWLVSLSEMVVVIKFPSKKYKIYYIYIYIRCNEQ